jgi:hypothetical protein
MPIRKMNNPINTIVIQPRAAIACFFVNAAAVIGLSPTPYAIRLRSLNVPNAHIVSSGAELRMSTL